MVAPNSGDYDTPEEYQEAVEDYYDNVDYEYDQWKDDQLTERDS